MFDLDGLLDRSESLAGADVFGLPFDDLSTMAKAVAAAQSYLSLAQAHVLAEMSVSGSCQARTNDKPAAWLAKEASLPRRATENWVRTGVVLRRFDKIDAAVANGELTFEHAAALVQLSNARVEPGLLAVQDFLLEQAREHTFKGFRDQLRRFIAEIDQDGGHDPDDDITRNELHISETLDGIELRGRLVGAMAESVREAIDVATQDLFRRIRADSQLTPDIAMPPPKTLRAIALYERLRAGGAVDLASTKPPKPEFTLVAPATDPDRVTDDTGVRVDHPSFDALLCDPRMRPVVVDNLGVPLAMGHARDLATKDQKRALALRDGPHCIWPGCDRPSSWTDAHHVKHRKAMNGRTDTENLGALCRLHHMGTHRTGWQMHTAPDGWHYWISPSGDRFWQQRHQRLRTDPPPTGAPPAAAAPPTGAPTTGAATTDPAAGRQLVGRSPGRGSSVDDP